MISVRVIEQGRLREGGRELALCPGTRWIDIEGQTPEEIAWLGATFGFHPLALEDCLHLNQRAKFEDYPSSLFLVLHTFVARGEDPCALERRELHAFLTEDLLVTVHEEPLAELDQVLSRLRRVPDPLNHRPDLLLHHVCDAVVDAQFPVIEQIRETLDTLENEVLERAEPHLLQRAFNVREALVQLRRGLSPERDVLLQLTKGVDKRVSERTSLYFRDVHDHALRNADAVEAARDALKDVMSAYHSAAANRTSEIVKRLTLFSAIFLPLTFVTGFFGMNFEHLPFGNDGLLVAALLSMLLLPAAMVAWFWLSRWI